MPLRAQRCEGDLPHNTPLDVCTGKACGGLILSQKTGPGELIRKAHGQTLSLTVFPKGE